MNYGIIILIISTALFSAAVTTGGWNWLFLWPAFSFSLVGIAYLFRSPQFFGKTKSGTLSPINFLLLLPFLLFAWTVWRLIRIFRREPPVHQLTETIFVGRRLLDAEFPDDINHVVDLTCEFVEPASLRNSDYHCFPILDHSIPGREEFERWIEEVSNFDGPVFIHCAEGHGRTGLFAAALLKAKGHSETAEEALAFIQEIRPLVRLNRGQFNFLRSLD